MNLEIVLPVITISCIAIAVGCILKAFGKINDGKFDERQLIERGRGANLAMDVALVYMLGLYSGLSFDLLPQEHMIVFAIYGLTLTIMVFHGYCIFHDAYLNREQGLTAAVWQNGMIGALWLCMTILRRERWGSTYEWIFISFAMVYLFQSMMLLLRAIVLHIRDRMEELENADG